MVSHCAAPGAGALPRRGDLSDDHRRPYITALVVQSPNCNPRKILGGTPPTQPAWPWTSTRSLLEIYLRKEG